MNSKWGLLKQENLNTILPRVIEPFCKKCYSNKIDPIGYPSKEKAKLPEGKGHKQQIAAFFRKHPHLDGVKANIPLKYFDLKRKTPPENLYLIDENVAKKAVSYIIPEAKHNTDNLICETNAGLGLITEELLKEGVPLVRMYESCSEFKDYLKSAFEGYKGRVELFTKDIFLLARYDYIDRQDNGNRVEQLLKGIPKKHWTDDPVMTIIGPMANQSFIRFLLKSLVLQTYTVSLGRFQLYVFMKPRDYIIATAGPHLNLHTYQRISVLFNLFFDYELLEKFPREVFLPWQSPKSASSTRFPGQVDLNYMYFVKITFKKELPVSYNNILPFYVFVNQFFGSGNKRIVPVLEKWVPGVGLDIIHPKLPHSSYFKDLNIFTRFGELTPTQILSVFQEMVTHPEYSRDHFMTIIESHLIKTETIDTNMDEHLAKTEILSSNDP